MFRTELNLSGSEQKISLDSPILSIGSCFAEMIGQRLMENKFNTLSNPYGVIFNPLSVFNLLRGSLDHNPPDSNNYVQNGGVFYHYDLHSDFSDIDLGILKQRVHEQCKTTGTFLKAAKWVMITLGTAFVYELKEKNHIVANCHKLPSTLFTKRLLEVAEIKLEFEKFFNYLKSINPHIRIIITVSPVRHTKDSLELNNVSKSILRLSAHQICSKWKNVEYFPSYEILMDDLRDYRFYKPDLVHPSEMAEDYIWNKFSKRYFDEETLGFLEEWKSLKKAIMHKPFHPHSDAHQAFLKNTITRLERLANKININQELELLQSQTK